MLGNVSYDGIVDVQRLCVVNVKRSLYFHVGLLSYSSMNMLPNWGLAPNLPAL